MLEEMCLKDVKVGSTIFDKNTKYDREPIEWILVDKPNPYNGNANILMSKNILTFKAFDSNKRNQPGFTREQDEFGCSNFKQSTILYWLQERGECDWENLEKRETQGPIADRVSCNNYERELGFLFSFSSYFYDNLKEIDIVTKDDIISTKVFLPSLHELGVFYFKEKVHTFQYFKHFGKRKRIAHVSKNALERADDGFKKIVGDYESITTWEYLTRSVDNTGAFKDCRVYTIDERGNKDSIFAFNGIVGVRPCIAVFDKLKVKRHSINSFEVQS